MTEHEPDEVHPEEAAEGAAALDDPGFGEQDEAAQEAEWEQDGEEDGASEA